MFFRKKKNLWLKFECISYNIYFVLYIINFVLKFRENYNFVFEIIISTVYSIYQNAISLKR